MKKTQWVALLQNIKKTFISFLSIVIFVALGEGVAIYGLLISILILFG